MVCRVTTVIGATVMALTSLAAPAWPQAPSGQAPAAPPDEKKPAFKAQVDVVLVDVAVLDGQGEPVRALGPADFEVRVDGKRRKVLSAEMVEYGITAAPPPSLPRLQTDYDTNEGEAAGRIVMLVMDLGSFKPGEERQAVAAANQFLDSLTPSDKIGVATLPWTDVGLDFTADTEHVRKVVGSMIGSKADLAGPSGLGVSECMRASRGDTSAYRQIVSRTCGANASAPPQMAAQPGGSGGGGVCDQPGYEPDCPCMVQDRIKRDIDQIVSQVRYDGQRQARGLVEVMNRLRAFSGPKMVVVISQGAVVDDIIMPRSLLGSVAGLADARVSVIGIERSAYDASSGERPRERLDDVQFFRNGLEDLSAMMGGGMYRALGQVQAHVDRIWRESAVSWRLGVEPTAQDLDGKAHRLEVKMAKPRLTVRTRSHFIVDTSKTPTNVAADRLRSALFSPVPEVGLPVRLTHYGTPRPATGEVVVRVVGDVEIPPGPAAPQVVFVFVDSKGRQVAAGTGDLKNQRADVSGRLRFSSTVALPPGSYVLRLAAVAPDGRAGSVQRPVEFVPIADDGMTLSDVVLTEMRDDESSTIDAEVAPVIRNGRLLAYVELARGSAADATGTDVIFEIAGARPHRLLMRVRVPVRPGPAPQTDVVLGEIDVKQLSAGSYLARAVGTREGRKVESPWRAFWIAGS